MLARELLTAKLTLAQQAQLDELLHDLEAVLVRWTGRHLIAPSAETSAGASARDALFAALLQATLQWAGGVVGLIGAFETWELDGPSLDEVATYFKRSLPTLLRAVRVANGLPPEPFGRRRRRGEEDPT